MIVTDILDIVSDAMRDLSKRMPGATLRPLDIVLLSDRTGTPGTDLLFPGKHSHEGVVVTSDFIGSKKVKMPGTLMILVMDKSFKKPMRFISIDYWNIVSVIRPCLHPVDRFMVCEIKKIMTSVYKSIKVLIAFGGRPNLIMGYLREFKLVVDGKINTFIHTKIDF